jgi:anti-sigma factor RsiW
MNQNLELKLQAWLDGELSGAEARRINDEIAADAGASRLVEELKAVKGLLAGNELALTVPESRDFYWSKIEREIRNQARPQPAPTFRTPAWVRWLSPLSGLAAFTCIILLAVKPTAAPTFDEISSTGEGVEAVTFHDQSADMTVVWLADSTQPQTQPQTQTPEVSPEGTAVPPDHATPDPGDTDVEME